MEGKRKELSAMKTYRISTISTDGYGDVIYKTSVSIIEDCDIHSLSSIMPILLLKKRGGYRISLCKEVYVLYQRII